MTYRFLLMVLTAITSVSITLVGTPCFAIDPVIIYAKPESSNDPRHQYFVELLTLALKKNQSVPSPLQLKATVNGMQQGRAIRQLSLGKKIDVVWTVTSIAREQQLLPIRIPLLRGLLGLRVLLIRKEDLQKFSFRTLDDLQQFSAGQGHDWPDTTILKANNINVITATTYDGLFNMLKAGRFDYFPRGVTEAWLELKAKGASTLMVEQHALLYYPSPVYFFVNLKNTKLAKRIEKGLRLAIADGSFEQLFNRYHLSNTLFTNQELSKRKVIPLHNPLLPPLTPLADKTLWYQLK